ncbi:hypothetical protein GCM10011335_37590 [Aureimonas glaciei]|uniref:Uncharacterized protein n=1 Tax=Aureimonas glaciei TaxID=1776957 RepID=A0A917DEN4_9HYPH|nr:hypothetical protein GCM10011335_37590 [Aureimonas glaciei]
MNAPKTAADLEALVNGNPPSSAADHILVALIKSVSEPGARTNAVLAQKARIPAGWPTSQALQILKCSGLAVCEGRARHPTRKGIDRVKLVPR